MATVVPSKQRLHFCHTITPKYTISRRNSYLKPLEIQNNFWKTDTTYSPVDFSDNLAIFGAVYFMSYFESKFSAESKSDWCQSPDVERFEKIDQIYNGVIFYRQKIDKIWFQANIVMLYLFLKQISSRIRIQALRCFKYKR